MKQLIHEITYDSIKFPTLLWHLFEISKAPCTTLSTLFNEKKTYLIASQVVMQILYKNSVVCVIITLRYM